MKRMTVKQLIKALSKLPENAVLVCGDPDDAPVYFTPKLKHYKAKCEEDTFVMSNTRGETNVVIVEGYLDIESAKAMYGV